MMVSEDGGRNFQRLGEADKHVDNHAMVIDPQDPNHLLIGCDGGVYETWDRGATYDFKANLPITQFYKVAVSNERPFYYVYGGTQDNATQGGPSRTTNSHGIRNSDWFITVFGDGFRTCSGPTDPDTIYSQWQYGGLVRFDRRSGETVDIKPQEAADGPPAPLELGLPAVDLAAPAAADLLRLANPVSQRRSRGFLDADQWRSEPRPRSQPTQGHGQGLGRGRSGQEWLDILVRQSGRPGRVAVGRRSIDHR